MKARFPQLARPKWAKKLILVLFLFQAYFSRDITYKAEVNLEIREETEVETRGQEVLANLNENRATITIFNEESTRRPEQPKESMAVNVRKSRTVNLDLDFNGKEDSQVLKGATKP